jgi:hypothetical protein
MVIFEVGFYKPGKILEIIGVTLQKRKKKKRKANSGPFFSGRF